MQWLKIFINYGVKEMNCEEICKPTNKTPMIYTGGDFIKPYENTFEFIKELAELYNKYNIDVKLNMYDLLLAEMTYNFLAVMSNTIKSNDKLCGKSLEQNE